jgi:multiple sugar transport system substrate-binding protein
MKEDITMKTRMHRRMLTSTSIAIAAALTLSGCAVGGGNESTELSEEDVTLTLSWWGADARTQQTNEAIDLFEEEYPNITVEGQFADWTGYWDRLATSTAGGDMPDVSQFDQLYLASYANRGTLLDLSKFPDILDTSAIPEELLNSGKIDDAQYAVPIGGTPHGVIINTAVFEELGVPVPDTTSWTWDEFTSTAKAITDASAGKVHGVIPFGSDSFSLTIWARQQGESLFNEDGDISISPETLAGYWDQEMSFINEGTAPSVAHLSEVSNVTLDQSDLALGTVAMGFIPAGQMTAFQSASPNATFVLGNWPTNSDTAEGFQYLKPSMYWTAAASSEHPAETALLIDFLTTDERVGKLFGTDRGVPANPAFQDAIAPDLDESGKESLSFTSEITETVGDAPAITPNGASDIEIILGRYNQQVQFGELTTIDAATAFIKEIQASIDAAK